MSAVSVVIPVRNGEAYLREAIDSVLAQAVPVELIVADDGSADATPAIATSYGNRVIYLPGERRGAAAARNRGVAAATGQWLAFLDADDVWMPRKLEHQLMLLKNSDAALAFGWMQSFHSPELSQAKRRALPAGKVLPGYSSGALLMGRVGFLSIGGFDERLASGDFIDWYARAQEAGCRPAMLGEVVLRRRLHGKNLGLTHGGQGRDYARVLKSALDRRRAG